jgi:hypothetical protein
MMTRMQLPRWTALAASVLLFAASPAHASLFEGETLDAVADGASWVVLVIAPIVGIVVFWILHIIPEKIAEKREHPQANAIQALCLLSLVFGGLLWPFAMLWAVTKPVMFKAAYGYDRLPHGQAPTPEYPPAAPVAVAPATTAPLAAAPHDEVQRLRAELDRYTAEAPPTPEELRDLRARLAAVEATTSPKLST